MSSSSSYSSASLISLPLHLRAQDILEAPSIFSAMNRSGGGGRGGSGGKTSFGHDGSEVDVVRQQPFPFPAAAAADRIRFSHSVGLFSTGRG